MVEQDLALWAEDLRVLGREYLGIVRRVVTETPTEAMKLFGARRKESMNRLCLLTSAQMDLLLEHGGLPFGIGDEDRLHADLIDLDRAEPWIQLPKKVAADCEALQMAYFERMRSIARHSPGTAASIFRLKNLHRVVLPVSTLSLSGLRKVAKLNHAMAINVSIAYELLISMLACNVNEERFSIAGAAAIAAGENADYSLASSKGMEELQEVGQMKLLEAV